MVSRKVLASLLAALAAYAAACGPVCFPEGSEWSGVRCERKGNLVYLIDKNGARLATLRIEGNGIPADVSVRVIQDGVEIDSRCGAQGGRGAVVFETMPLKNILDYAGMEVALEVSATIGRGAKCSAALVDAESRGMLVSAMPFCGDPKQVACSVGALKAVDGNMRFRFAVECAGGVPVVLHRIRLGTVRELDVKMQYDYPPQKCIFRAGFEDTADAESAGRIVKPVCARGLEFVEGRRGRAIRVSPKNRSRLCYPLDGNLLLEQGTFAAWCKFEGGSAKRLWQMLFVTEPFDEKERLGTGAKRAWWHNGNFRVDLSDDSDTATTFGNDMLDGGWHHVVVTWSRGRVWAVIDGRSTWRGVASGPLYKTMAPVKPKSFSKKRDFETLSIGGDSNGNSFCGVIDEVEVFSAPMSPQEARDYYFAHGGKNVKCPDYAAIMDAKASNRYERSVSRPGEDPDLEFVKEVVLDNLSPCKRFRAVGACGLRELDGRKYIEGGSKFNDRFALGFSLDPSCPLYAFEIDYPDDCVRTMGITIQSARCPGRDYRMQCGVMTGREYPNTNGFLTHRVMWWTCGEGDVALILRKADHPLQHSRGVAAAAVRVYRVKNGKLPSAGVQDASQVDGWNRTLALYFEDPAISQSFLVPDTAARSPERWCDLLDKLAATMKFTGQNLLAYPAAWYEGMLGEEHDYNLWQRSHPPYFWRSIYEKFDREGLCAIPTLNQHDPVRHPEYITYERRLDGSLHSTSVSINSNGLPNGNGVHGCPPNFNIAHPEMQRMIEDEFDYLLQEGLPHPSFKGICLHLSRHSLHWFSTDEAGSSGGYNDYCIDAFEKAKMVKVAVDRSDPLRGRLYYEWIKSNAYDKWVEWRCDVVSGFYRRLAEKMKQRRSDLKLWINMEWNLNTRFVGFRNQDFFNGKNREGGIDADMFRGSNVVLSQTCVPGDTRWGAVQGLRGDDRKYLEELWREHPFFEFMKFSSFPGVNIHERYFESSVGVQHPKGSAESLSCEWLDEIPWRVETINPSGRNALAQFVGALAVQDVLLFSKGGYLMGNYGAERELADFARYFRALPAVVFQDVCSCGSVRVRSGKHAGLNYMYVANTSGVAVAACVDFGKGMRDLVTGDVLVGRFEMKLLPWEFRSFVQTEHGR